MAEMSMVCSDEQFQKYIEDNRAKLEEMAAR